MPRNLIWALDLTYCSKAGKPSPVLGLIDHGTRACIALRSLRAKGSVVILRALLDAVERFGTPKILRTDNEPIFTSALFRLGLAMLGIRQQRTAPFAPWQNGRVERFFGSLKGALRRRPTAGSMTQGDLDIFRGWHNHIRPHQNLGGLTPARAWEGKATAPAGRPLYFSEWEEALTGFYFPS